MSSVVDFYSGKAVLVTGGTGFMGKVLIEKLLRCCPDVKVIYIFVRSKAGLSVQTRVQDITKCKVFDRVREAWPNFHEKIKPIHADLLEPNIAISPEDTQELLSEVNVVFHCAATVRFDEPLKYALQMNLVGTQRLLVLAKQMQKLEVFIHFSTAFAHCNRKHVEEIIYTPPVEPNKFVELVELMDESLVEEITPKLIYDWPNTYTFTKALSEYIIQQEKGNLNVVIIRPSIVGACWQDPFPGWIDAFNGMTAYFIGYGKGILRAVQVDMDSIADFIPVDVAINLTLAAGWYSAVHRPKSLLIYNCVTGASNPIRWREVETAIIALYKKFPLDKAFRIPKCTWTTSEMFFQYLQLINQKIPGFFYDLHLKLTRRKPRVMKLFDRFQKPMKLLHYFTIRSWDWDLGSMNTLMNQLSPKDKKLFFFDIRNLNWNEYIESCCLGTKMYLLKEDIAGVPAAKRHLRKLRTRQYAFNTIFFIIILRIFIARSQMAQNGWYFIVSLCYKLLNYFRASNALSLCVSLPVWKEFQDGEHQSHMAPVEVSPGNDKDNPDLASSPSKT